MYLHGGLPVRRFWPVLYGRGCRVRVAETYGKLKQCSFDWNALIRMFCTCSCYRCSELHTRLGAEYTFMLVFLIFVFVCRWGFMAMFMYKRHMGNWNTTQVIGTMSSKYSWANFPCSWALFSMIKSIFFFFSILICCVWTVLQPSFSYPNIPLCSCSSSFSSCAEEILWPWVSCSCSKGVWETEKPQMWLKQQAKQ